MAAADHAAAGQVSQLPIPKLGLQAEVEMEMMDPHMPIGSVVFASQDPLADLARPVAVPSQRLTDNEIRDILKNSPSGQRILYMISGDVTLGEFRQVMLDIARAIEAAVQARR